MTDNALELVAQPVAAPPTLFGTNDPREGLERMRQTAKVLAGVIKQKQLYKKIGDKHHVYVEAWTFLGSMLGVFPVTVWTRPLEAGPGWEARVEARTLSGQVVGAAEASCIRTEKNWGNRDDFALRSMAQTRATSKALRMPLGFIVLLAGYNPTPAEEMPADDLTERLEASIAAVRAKKAAAAPGNDLGNGRAEESHGAQAAAASVASIQAKKAAAKKMLASVQDSELRQVVSDAREFKAPPLCPECKSPVGRFISESKQHKGRAYWECQRRNDKVLELLEQGLTYRQILPARGVEGHWRTWAEPWPRKEEPRDGQP